MNFETGKKMNSLQKNYNTVPLECAWVYVENYSFIISFLTEQDWRFLPLVKFIVFGIERGYSFTETWFEIVSLVRVKCVILGQMILGTALQNIQILKRILTVLIFKYS